MLQIKSLNKISPCIFLAFGSYLTASDVYISENYQNHYCKNIEPISVSSDFGTKEELFTLLKKQAKDLGGNSIIKAEYETKIFGMKSVARGIAANCDVQKSPSFFIKSNYNDNKESSLFTQIALGSESVTIDKQSSSESLSSASGGIKFGLLDNNYRVYGDLKVGVGLNLLASADYIYNLNQNFSLFGGGSFGSSQYQLKTSSDYIYSLIQGFQVGARYNQFELTFQKLSATSKTEVNGVPYKPSDITSISLGYYF